MAPKSKRQIVALSVTVPWLRAPTGPQGRDKAAAGNIKTKIFPVQLTTIHGLKSWHLPSYGPTAKSALPSCGPWAVRKMPGLKAHEFSGSLQR